MKFSTDVLLIAPAVMGVIFSISRIWDAISDPIAGYLSDRTTFKFGRRRTWMLLSFIPIAFGFLAVFSPPESMQGQSLDLWMMIAILSFYSAITLFNVPHMALGAELSEDYHERTRLFGVRHIGFTLGSILSLVSMSLLISEENNPTGNVRELASNLALFAVAVMSLMIFFSVSRLKENPDFQNRVNKNPFKAFRDIWVNPHARILIIVLFIENLGGAVIGVLTLYVTQYIVEAPAWAPLIISVLGIDNSGKVFLLFMVSLSIMIISARAGASGTQLSKIHAAHSLGATKKQILRHVIFPNSLPEILTGIRVAVGMCWGTLVAAEFLAGTTGIGFVENVAKKYFQYEVIWITIFIMGLLGLLFDISLRKIIDKTIPWRGKG